MFLILSLADDIDINLSRASDLVRVGAGSEKNLFPDLKLVARYVSDFFM